VISEEAPSPQTNQNNNPTNNNSNQMPQSKHESVMSSAKQNEVISSDIPEHRESIAA
jgi:hypothetical protein